MIITFYPPPLLSYISPSTSLIYILCRSLPSSSDAINCCGNPLPPLTRENSSEVLSIVSEVTEDRQNSLALQSSISLHAHIKTSLNWVQCTAMEEDRGVVNQTLDSQMQHSNFIQVCVCALGGGGIYKSSS